MRAVIVSSMKFTRELEKRGSRRERKREREREREREGGKARLKGEF